MGIVSIINENGKKDRFSTYFGSWSNYIKQDLLINEFHKKGLSEKEVISLRMEDEELEIAWGAQFTVFPNLTSVELVADKKIRLNCYNFKDSAIRTINLHANELWFNDGAFCDSKALEFVTCNGKILDGQHGGLTELLFQNCPKLRSVCGTYKGTKVMPFVFKNCTSLEVPLDLYVEYLGYGTFMDCTNLKHIHLHNGLIELGPWAFQNCISLEDIYVPDTVTDLGLGSFAGCKNLKKIHLPQSLSRIPSGTFADCSELNKVFLSDDITKIESDAFKGCSSLHRPWFPEKLKSIGKRAFQGCISLENVFLPDNISEIGEDAFSDCGNLIIHGKPGTYAEQYAKDNGLLFIAK